MGSQLFNALNLNAYCPNCESDEGVVQHRVTLLPGVGKVLKSIIQCRHCHFNNLEFLPFQSLSPSTFKFLIKSKSDLSAKVIKSPSCVFKIPELGVEVGPGPESQAEILNVDGLLSNITLALNYEYGQNKLSSDIKLIKAGKKKATLVLEDPLGFSRIIPKRGKA